ncbi:MAG: YaaA family protein [Bacteroides sp.]|nr:YaaA family protein [Bacteroides sp.]
MIILIAESKTMEKQEFGVSTEYYETHKPVGEKEAAEIMERLKDMTLSDISSIIKISNDLAVSLRRMTYEFPNKNMGLRTIEAFTGVVFRNFDYRSLSSSDKEWTTSKVRIISSLYGWLKPEDIIKPYRLDYTSPVSPDDTSLYIYWRERVTTQLISDLQATGENQILNLLPADAAKCVDWKTVKRFAEVWKVDFKEQHGVTIRSPYTEKLKALRGKLLRNIVLNRFKTPQQTATFGNDIMIPIPDYEYPDRLGFYV